MKDIFVKLGWHTEEVRPRSRIYDTSYIYTLTRPKFNYIDSLHIKNANRRYHVYQPDSDF